MNYAIGFMANTVPTGGSDATAGTGKADSKPQTRYLDTLKFFWQWCPCACHDRDAACSALWLQ
jgi:hypothetical protein